MITDLIDASLSHWEQLGANSLPREIPERMRTGVSEDDWVYWKAIDSTVTDSDIGEISGMLGVELSPQYVALLRHKHFMELQFGEVSIFPHPVDLWKATIRKAVFGGYPKELLIEKGFLPFADFSDWGLWCFGLNERNSEEEYPIYLWDHDRPEEFVRVADDLESGLKQQLKTKDA